MTPIDDEMEFTAFAELAVQFGCNVQPGQVLSVTAEVGSEEAVHPIAEAAYRRGAAYVDVVYEDPHVVRSRLRHVDEDTLDFVPAWRMARIHDVGADRQARVRLTASRHPRFFDGIDPRRVSRVEIGAEFAVWLDHIGGQLANWSVLPFPTPAWAELVHPGLAPEQALRALSRQLAYVCRLDAPDPIAAWRERVSALGDVARRLTARRFDALRFRGPGTDLTIGLLPGSLFTTTFQQTVDGVWHMANLPSEEILTAPDPTRADGVVRATKPLYLGGVVIEDLEVEFAAGRAVRIDGSGGVDALRAAVASHAGGDRIGEVAMVDGDGRIGEFDTIFYNTLIDENAASHLALGNAYTFCVEPEERTRINRSDMHVDFMVGSDEVTVEGATAGGAWVEVLAREAWKI